MPTPSTVQSPTTYNYVSSLDLVQNLHKPEIDSAIRRSKLNRIYGNARVHEPCICNRVYSL